MILPMSAYHVILSQRISYHCYHLQYHKWWQSWHHDNYWFSLFLVADAYIYIYLQYTLIFLQHNSIYKRLLVEMRLADAINPDDKTMKDVITAKQDMGKVMKVHEAVLLPGFAIYWEQNQVTREPHLRYLIHIMGEYNVKISLMIKQSVYHKIYTICCCALFCCCYINGSGLMGSIYIYSMELFHWHRPW